MNEKTIQAGQVYLCKEDERRGFGRRTLRVISAEPDSCGRIDVTSHNEKHGRIRNIKVSTRRLLSADYELIQQDGAIAQKPSEAVAG